MQEGQHYQNVATKKFFTLEKRTKQYSRHEYQYRLNSDDGEIQGIWMDYYPMIRNIFDGFKKVEG